MASTPVRPDEVQKIAPETERVLRERDAMFEKEYPKREQKEKAMRVFATTSIASILVEE
jgi:hypothetical protein